MSAPKSSEPSERAASWPIVLWLVQLPLAALLVAPAALSLSGRRLASNTAWMAAFAGLAWALATTVLVLRPAGRRWLRAHRFQLLALIISSALSLLLLGEIGVRLIEKRDEDGNVVVRFRQIHPFRLPLKNVAAKLELYRSAGETTISLEADPELGWAPRPGSSRPPYFYERAGIRAADPHADYAEKPGPALRVAVFGDSFTTGTGVTHTETWASELEHQAAPGRVEVLNFGVPGYGMDQALLRYRKTGRRFKPDVVVFGLQLENVHRNTNVMRPFYFQATDLPLTKPRFIVQGGALRLLNSPTVPPERIVATISAFQDWPLARYEPYYDPADYRVRFWHLSHLVTLAVDTTAGILSDLHPSETSADELDLAVRIMGTFAKEVEEYGARFVVLHLPVRAEVEADLAGKPSPVARERAAFTSHFPLIESAGALKLAARAHGVPALFNESMHYSPAGNRAVASALVPTLVGLPPPSR